MSAATLRRAASLMRERAAAVDGMEWWNVDSLAEVTNYDDAEHFVSFGRPTVALAVAARLETAAHQWTQLDKANSWGDVALTYAHLEDDLAVARAYLGGSE